MDNGFNFNIISKTRGVMFRSDFIVFWSMVSCYFFEKISDSYLNVIAIPSFINVTLVMTGNGQFIVAG